MKDRGGLRHTLQRRRDVRGNPRWLLLLAVASALGCALEHTMGTGDTTRCVVLIPPDMLASMDMATGATRTRSITGAGIQGSFGMSSDGDLLVVSAWAHEGGLVWLSLDPKTGQAVVLGDAGVAESVAYSGSDWVAPRPGCLQCGLARFATPQALADGVPSSLVPEARYERFTIAGGSVYGATSLIPQALEVRDLATGVLGRPVRFDAAFSAGIGGLSVSDGVLFVLSPGRAGGVLRSIDLTTGAAALPRSITGAWPSGLFCSSSDASPEEGSTE